MASPAPQLTANLRWRDHSKIDTFLQRLSWKILHHHVDLFVTGCVNDFTQLHDVRVVQVLQDIQLVHYPLLLYFVYLFFFFRLETEPFPFNYLHSILDIGRFFCHQIDFAEATTSQLPPHYVLLVDRFIRVGAFRGVDYGT